MKRRRPASLEDYLIMACVLLMLGYVLFILMTGCANSKQAQKVQMIWLDDECFLYIDGMEAGQAEQIQNDWSLERCNVDVNSKAGKEEPPPEGEG